ncbi:MAG: helix-turn-helix domain-containing protein [Dehalococcoidia bacterium]
MTRDVMTPEQVGEFLQVTTETVYRLIRRRDLAASRVGRTYRILKEDLDSYLRANSTRPEVRAALWRRVREIAQRNADIDGDALLDELEREDDERKARARAAS